MFLGPSGGSARLIWRSASRSRPPRAGGPVEAACVRTSTEHLARGPCPAGGQKARFRERSRRVADATCRGCRRCRNRVRLELCDEMGPRHFGARGEPITNPRLGGRHEAGGSHKQADAKGRDDGEDDYR